MNIVVAMPLSPKRMLTGVKTVAPFFTVTMTSRLLVVPLPTCAVMVIATFVFRMAPDGCPKQSALSA